MWRGGVEGWCGGVVWRGWCRGSGVRDGVVWRGWCGVMWRGWCE